MSFNTPPIEMNRFTVKSDVTDVPLFRIFAGVAPFIVADLIALLLIILIPGNGTILLAQMQPAWPARSPDCSASDPPNDGSAETPKVAEPVDRLPRGESALLFAGCSPPAGPAVADKASGQLQQSI